MVRKNRSALDQLKVKYDGKSVDEILSECREDRKKALKGRRDLILKLFYFERTNRFREFKEWEKTTFEVFLEHEPTFFNLRYGTYYDERIAFTAHEKYALIYGPAFVTRVRKLCGPLKVDTVFSKLKPDDSYEKKEKIIGIYAKPKKEKKPKVNIPTEIEKVLRDEVNEQKKMVDERDEQIKKLKAAVVKVKKERDKIRAKYEELLKRYNLVVSPIVSQIEDGRFIQPSV